MISRYFAIGQMSEDEIFILVVAAAVAGVWLCLETFTAKHRLFFRRATGAGLVRLAFLLSMAWTAYVLANHADPSVVGVYRLFYMVLGAAVVAVFGLGASGRTGVRFTVDVLERRNPAAGLLVAAFVLATGLVFGGSVWGEADPDGEGEGGWWIPLGFFLAGWISLVISTALYRRRDTGGQVRRMRQLRNPGEVLAFVLYILSCGWILTEAVSGDFYGWRHGLTAVAAIAAMLMTREIVGLVFARGTPVRPQAMRGVEVGFYIAWSAGFTVLSRYVLPHWGVQL